MSNLKKIKEPKEPELVSTVLAYAHIGNSLKGFITA